MRLRALALVVATLTTGCTAALPWSEPDERYAATIRWTSYGIPHIETSDWGGLGFGYGYAGAKDYLCMIAEEYVTTNGERSRYFGPDETYSLTSNGQTYTNRESDLYFTLLREHPDLVASIADFPRPEIQDAIDGYVAGYNRYLQDTPPSQRSVDCRDAAWVRPITRDDVVHRANKVNLIASMGFFAPYMVRAIPPSGAPSEDDGMRAPLPTAETLGLGSNGYAFGSQMTANGRGMLLGNPHFSWQGPERFHEVHFTIRGQVDVMGMTLLGVPLVLIGFTEHVAWTHTVSTAWRFSAHELKLVPGDPTSYLVDGAVEAMTVRTVTIDTGSGTESHDFYFSRYGPVIDYPVAAAQAAGLGAGLVWTPATAYSIHDANAGNNRTVEQFHQWATAGSFDEFVEDLKETHGVPWVNTIAASPDGRALYADVSVVPNYDADKIALCNTPVGRALFAAARLPVFDGSRSECGPTLGESAAQDDIIPADEMPLLVTEDWLINANDDAWLPNPDHPIVGYSPMIGPGPSERTPRTRMAYVLADEFAPGTLTLDGLQGALFSSRLYVPETELDNILRGVCTPALALSTSGQVVDLGEACDILRAWDRRADLESAGLPLFELFWARAPKTWLVPFDANDGAGTPRQYAGADPRARAALADAVLLMQSADLPLGITAGDARATTRQGERIPVHGAAGGLGSPSLLTIPFIAGAGFAEPIHGNSYIQTVTWDDEGRVVAHAILAYSQSPHSDSPHHADQTRLYAAKEWVVLPFRMEDILADPALVVVELST